MEESSAPEPEPVPAQYFERVSDDGAAESDEDDAELEAMLESRFAEDDAKRVRLWGVVCVSSYSARVSVLVFIWKLITPCVCVCV